MNSSKFFKIFVIFLFIVLLVNFYVVFFYTNLVIAQQKYQKMSEMKVSPNIRNAGLAIIPESYGSLKGVENVGKSTMLWFESKDGTIRRVNLSFWENEVILDDVAIVIERK